MFSKEINKIPNKILYMSDHEWHGIEGSIQMIKLYNIKLISHLFSYKLFPGWSKYD